MLANSPGEPPVVTGNSLIWRVKSYLGLKSCHCEQKRSHPEILDRQAESIVASSKSWLIESSITAPLTPRLVALADKLIQFISELEPFFLAKTGGAAGFDAATA